MAQNKLKQMVSGVIPEIVLTLVFLILQIQHINSDFWNDEIYTLKQFTFTSIQKTLLDYHVPNNHILFNLINNIYLKLIHIETLSELMEAPYKLRVVTLFYSLLTLLYIYKIGLKFYNRRIALLTVGVLITTIPFYYFSLQIRGYGLSTLLLTALVYYSLSYLQLPKRSYLVIVVLTTLFLGYSIPSNFYFEFSLAVIIGLSLFYDSFVCPKKRNIHRLRYFFSDSKFRLILALTLGVALTLLFFLPIFRDVFMNEYVKRGVSFELSKLKFYLPHLIEGIVSARWGIIILGGIGFVSGFQYQKKWTLPTLISLSIILIPIILVYARGDSPPLRVFVVILPFTSLIIAIGIQLLWRSVIRMIPIPDNYVIFGLFFYSLLVFQIERISINAKVFNDIRTENRSQDLYRQYYSNHYQPLKDVRVLKEICQKQNLPVLVHGCEPHGIPNYLDKFDLPYFEKEKFDSLLSIYDSIYIVTNHPFKFSEQDEYEVVILNQELTYHNVLLYYKKPFSNTIMEQLSALSLQYADSIQFVFNTFSSTAFSNQLDTTIRYTITDNVNLSTLIDITKRKPYLCFLSTVKDGQVLYSAIVADKHQFIKTIGNYDGIVFELLKTDENEKNNLEAVSQPLSMEKLDDQKRYSTSFIYEVDSLIEHLNLQVSFNGKFKNHTDGILVLSIDRLGKSIFWEREFLYKYYGASHDWQRVIATFDIDLALKPGDIIKTYVWDIKEEKIWVDDFRVEMHSNIMGRN